MKDFCVLITYYDKGNSFRRRNVKKVIDNYIMFFPECDVCVIEQNHSGFFDGYMTDEPRFRHIEYELGDEFKKTTLLNNGVRSNEGYKAYVMGDADALLDLNTFDYIRNHWNDGALVFPYSDVIYMDEDDTRRVIAGRPLRSGPKNHGVTITRQTGLCNVFTRETFDKVGGFDEAFQSWGAEDDAFVVKCKRLAGKVVRNTTKTGVVLHMFHLTANSKSYLKSNRYIYNRKLCACIRRMSDEDLNGYVNKRISIDVLMEKYEAMGRLRVELEWRCTPNRKLCVDTTLYDVDYSGEMSFSKILDAVLVEDGPEYTIEFLDSIIGSLPGLTPAQKLEISTYREKLCNLVKITGENTASQK